MNNQTYVALNNGTKIPQFGLGVYMIMGDQNTKEVCLTALKENINIFDFSLTDEEMRRIKMMDKGIRFFNMSLAEQEQNLGRFVPAD